jgi:hypothetical protein
MPDVGIAAFDRISLRFVFEHLVIAPITQVLSASKNRPCNNQPLSAQYQ